MKTILSLTLALIIVLASSILSKAQTSNWLPGESKDDIETFYRIEKTGSSSYDISIKVKNNRTKQIAVQVSEQLNKSKKVAEWLKKDSYPVYSPGCFVTVKPGESGECVFEANTNQIRGITFYWNNGNSIRRRTNRNNRGTGL